MRKWKNRIGVFIAIFSMVFTCLPSLKVQASNQDRVSAFISMFCGDEMSKDDLKNMELTERDTEFFGVWLSNWYVPFFTQVGRGQMDSSEEDEEDDDKKEEDIGVDASALVKVVTDDTSFSEENAKMLVATVFSAIRNDSKPLVAYVGKTEKTATERVELLSNCNLSTFLTCMAGTLPSLTTDLSEMLQNGKKNIKPEVADKVLSDIKLINSNKYVTFVAEGGNSSNVAFSANYKYASDDSEPPTISQQILWQCYSEVGWDENNRASSALAVFDLTVDEMKKQGKSDKSDPDDIMNDLMTNAPDVADKTSVDNTTIMVDPFGDLLVAGYNYQFIALPACVNPYRWVNVYNHDDEEARGGDSIPALSAPVISRLKVDTEGEATIIPIKGTKYGTQNKEDMTNGATALDDKDKEEAKDLEEEDKKEGESNSNSADTPNEAPDASDLNKNFRDYEASGEQNTNGSVSDGYIEQMKRYIGGGKGNSVITGMPYKQSEIVQFEGGTVEKWQSVSSYGYLKNPDRNNPEDKAIDKATLVSLLKIAANSEDGLGFSASNVYVDYDNGTWQLININNKHVQQMKVENIRQAFENHAEWEQSATKSAKQGYKELTKSAGLFSGTRFEAFKSASDDFYAEFEADLKGLKQTMSNTVMQVGDDSDLVGEKVKDQIEKDKKAEKKEIAEKTGRKQGDIVPEDKNKYTYTKMSFDVHKQKSGGIAMQSNGKYIFFPIAHANSRTQSDSGGWDAFCRVLVGGSFTKLEDIRDKRFSETTDVSDFAVFSPISTSSSEGIGFYGYKGGESSAGIKARTDAKYNLLTNYVAVDLLGLGKDERGNSDTFAVTQFLKADDPTADIDAFSDNSVDYFSKGIDTDKIGGLEGYRFTKDMTSYTYLTYMLAGVGNLSEKLGYRFTQGNFPELGTEPLDMTLLDDENSDEEKNDDIRNWIYYLLHPTEGIDYLRIWADNKLKGLLGGLHDSMLGTTGIGSMTGTTRYKGFTGLTTCPTLQDTAFTAWMDSFYTSVMWFVIIGCIVVLLLGFISNQIDFSKLVLYGLAVAIMVVIPSRLINTSISVTNVVSSQFYDDKFIYWALMQHQMYNSEIDKAAKEASQSYDTYLRSLYKTNAEATQTQGSNSITVRWQAVKKLRSVEYTEGDNDVLNDERMSLYNVATKELDNMLNRSFDGQSFSETTTDYLYRNYIDIANNSRFIYKAIAERKPDLGKTLVTDGWTNTDLVKNIGNINKDSPYTNKPQSTLAGDNYIYVNAPLASKIVAKGFSTKELIETNAMDSLDSRVGISNDAFAFSQKSFNTDANIAETIKNTIAGSKEKADPNFDPSLYDNDEYYALASYALMSESPYYYFSWYLYGQGLSADATGSDGYKKLLIGSDNQGFFNMTTEDGKPTDYLKDFLDCERLFKYVIPYLRQGNDVIEEWAEVNGGIFTYDNVPLVEGKEDELNLSNSDNAELAQKYWHNLNVRRLYNCYCPWVDMLDGTSYAKPVTVNAIGKDYTIENPADPYSYPAERPMIFSRAEAESYGYTDGQLTEVELRIIKFEEESRKALFELLNYSNFDDSVLNAAASMEILFAFNQSFSDISIFGDKTEMYPTNFEVKDFSYDAYLRFILANNSADTATGDGSDSADTTALESMQQSQYGDTLSEKGFYQRIMAKGSLITGLLMIINDFLAQIVMPFIKYLFLILLYLLLIVEILVTVFKLAGNNQKYWKRYIKMAIMPLVKFCVLMIAMSAVISMMMGNHTSTLTGSEFVSMQFGSPDIALFAMIVIFGLVDWILLKILLGVWKDLKSDSKILAVTAKGMVLGAIAGITKGIKGGISDLRTSGADDQARDKGLFGSYNHSKDVQYADNPYEDDDTVENGSGMDNTPDAVEDEESSSKHANDINSKIESQMLNDSEK